MKVYYPSYYDLFNCLKGACPDSCCAKWEIVIDEATLNKYSCLKGEISHRINDALYLNKEGETCFRLYNERCPFLNNEGLCDIHIALGEDFTSEICKVHPRFIEEYDGFREISLSLSCPEVISILFDDKIEDKYPEPEYRGEDEALSLLIESRSKLLSQKADFISLASVLLEKAADNQLDIDLVYINEHPEIDIAFIKDYLYFILNNCDVLTPLWREYLINSLDSKKTFSELSSFINTNENKLQKALRYFIYRYYLKAVNDLDIYSRALYILMSCFSSVYIALVNEISFTDAIRLYSKETEHNIENIDKINEYFSRF